MGFCRIDLSTFHIKNKYNNPRIPIISREIINKNVKLGEYIITEEQIKNIDNYMSIQKLDKLPNISQHKFVGKIIIILIIMKINQKLVI